MLSEPEVINAVCAKLESQGYRIIQKLRTTQHGIDIVAVKQMTPTRKLYIEAKGGTSSKKNTKRYGQPFGTDQIPDHVAMAFYKAAKVLSSRRRDDVEVRAGIALPDTQQHRDCIKDIEPVLCQLGIAVFWTQESGNVQISSTWVI